MHRGFVKLYRKSWDHVFYTENRPSTKREAWEDILKEVNHTEKKVLIGNQVFVCGIGESLRSLESWASMFKWNISAVRRFFKLLSDMDQIRLNNETKTTRLTVLNYDIYNGERHDNDTKVKRKRHNCDTIVTTNNNYKNDNNILSWRNSFEIYRGEALLEFDKFLNNNLDEQAKYYPNLDLKLSLDKAFNNFWGTEAGWDYKKKSKNKNINWGSTFINSLSLKQNHVYKNSQQQVGRVIQ